LVSSQPPSLERVKRKPGRPSLQSSSAPGAKYLIVEAAAKVYADHGYHDCSVAMILEESGVSRPTFYRYFKSRHEVISAVIKTINNKLINKILDYVSDSHDMLEVFDKGVDAYFDWAGEMGKISGSIFHEIHDVQSPASTHRTLIMNEIAKMAQQSRRLSGQSFNLIVLDALLHVVEHLGHQAFWPNKKNEVQIAELKLAVKTITHSTLSQLRVKTN